MNSNPIASLIIGAVILGIGAASIYGISLLLTLAEPILGEKSLLVLLSTPLLLFIAYLIGHGFLEYRKDKVERK